MTAAPTAAPSVPRDADLADLAGLREHARSCRGCHLYHDAVRTVFGEGPAGARLLVAEHALIRPRAVLVLGAGRLTTAGPADASAGPADPVAGIG